MPAPDQLHARSIEPTGARPDRRPRPASWPLLLATAGYLGLVLQVTLGAVPWPTVSNEGTGGVLAPGPWLSAATWTGGSVAELLANVLLFVPLGLLARAALPAVPTVLVVALGALVTFAIEVVQIPLDRVSDPRDLVANTLGAAIGAAAAAAGVHVRALRPA